MSLSDSPVHHYYLIDIESELNGGLGACGVSRSARDVSAARPPTVERCHVQSALRTYFYVHVTVGT